MTSLKLRRLARHLLQLEVAKRAAIGCHRLADIESGRAQPLPDELHRLAQALDLAPETLLDRTPAAS